MYAQISSGRFGTPGGEVAIAADRENFGAEVEALAQQGIPIYASLRKC